MGELKQWAKENNPFIKLADGESYSGIFSGFAHTSHLGKKMIEYTIGGKSLRSSSTTLAAIFDEIPVGTKIKITRFGEGMATKYKVDLQSGTLTAASHNTTTNIDDVKWDE